MILIIGTYEDPAGTNIHRKMLDSLSWEGTEIFFQDEEILKYGDYHHVMINEPLIHAERIDEKLHEKIDFDEIIFISRHKSASGMSSLTVHPVGNWGEAQAGGTSRYLPYVNPHRLTSALRTLKKIHEENGPEGYRVSFEVTHHGPHLSTPSLFIETGGTDKEWNDENAIETIVKTLISMEYEEYTTVIGIGGGHYAPRFTEMAFSKKVSFGHMMPKYAVENFEYEIIKQALERSQADGVYIHAKSLKGADRRRITLALEEWGIKIYRSEDFPDLKL